MESQYYEHLLERQKTGKITQIILQPKFEIIKAYTKYGRKIRKAEYTPDFLVYYPDGTHEYIEIKGLSDASADLRRKLFDSQYPDVLKWICGVDMVNKRYTRWLDYDEVRKLRREKRKAKK
jgi:hypothetical protein